MPTRGCSLPGVSVGAGGVACDLAVDALQASDSLARGQGGAMAVLAVAGPGAMMSAPDIYMQKIVAGPRSAGVIDIDLSVTVNLQRIAASLDRTMNEITVITSTGPGTRTSSPRSGPPVPASSSSPTATSRRASPSPSSGTGDHAYIGIGGTAEGIITAAAMRCLGGEIQAQVLAALAPRGRDRRASTASRTSRCG